MWTISVPQSGPWNTTKLSMKKQPILTFMIPTDQAGTNNKKREDDTQDTKPNPQSELNVENRNEDVGTARYPTHTRKPPDRYM